MKEIILMLTAGGAWLGVAVTGLIAVVIMFKDAWNSREWYCAVLGLLLLFCGVIPAFGMFASLFFIGG